MARLAVADTPQLARIYRESHAVWGGGLTPSAYAALWNEIGRTRWARRNLQILVRVDDSGRVLSSLKRYRTRARVQGAEVGLTALGAVFTPAAFRRQGHARALLRDVLGRSRDEGDALALLYSDIGTALYGSLGFRPLVAEEQWGALPRRPEPTPPGWVVRPMTDADRPWVQRAHQDTIASRALALPRDDEHWEFLRVRSEGYFARLGDPDLRSTSLVAYARGRFAGYVIAVEGRREWHVREVGAIGGDGERMAHTVRAAALLARQRGLRRCYAWFPPEIVAALGRWKLRSARRRRAVPMVCPLVPDLADDWHGDPAGGYVSYQDQF